MSQCVAVCCSVLQRVAVCCSVLQCVAVFCSVASMQGCVKEICSATCTRCCSVLQCVSACCSVLQRVVVCCSVAPMQGCVKKMLYMYQVQHNATHCNTQLHATSNIPMSLNDICSLTFPPSFCGKTSDPPVPLLFPPLGHATTRTPAIFSRQVLFHRVRCGC